MKVNFKFLKKIIKQEIIKEFVINKPSGINLTIDKTFMYSSTAIPYTELSLSLENNYEATKLFSFIKQSTNLTKKLTWKVKDNQIYTQIFFDKDLPKYRSHYLNKYLTQIREQLPISNEEEIQPYKPDDY